MTAAAKVSDYRSGWHHSGMDDRCVGAYAGTACTHPFHTTGEDGAVNAGSALLAKDTHEGPSSGPGVPAAPSSRPSLTFTISDDVELLSHDLAELLDDLEEIEALDALAQIRAARIALAQVESVLEDRAAKVMTGNVVEWPGGVAERRFGKDRKAWNNDELIRAVSGLIASTAACDTTSGEVDEMLAALIHDAIDQFASTHRPDWRITALKQIGVDPDAYCESVRGRTTVQITAAGEQ